jgi:hypothetical protein
MSFQKLLEDLEAISGSQNADGDDVTKSMDGDGDDAKVARGRRRRGR